LSNQPRLRQRAKAVRNTRNIDMVVKPITVAGVATEILSAAIRAARRLRARGRTQAQVRVRVVAEREASANRSVVDFASSAL
jgi:hypothetical protein